MMGTRHNPNVELIGQGVANIFSPLVGGLPATGAIARTATNIRSGAKTPVAGMIHALTLLAHSAVRGSARRAGTAGRAGGLAVHRRLQHGRVARNPVAAQDDQGRHRGLVRDVCAHRSGRSHGRGRGGNGAGGAPLHSAGRRNDVRCARDGLARSRKAACIRCRACPFPTTPPCIAFTGPSSSAPPTNSRRFSIISRSCRPSSSCGFGMCRQWTRRDCRHLRILPIRCGFPAARCCCAARASSRPI